MKSGRHISAILLAAAALLMTFGCVKEPVKVPIAVAPSVEKTKALVDGAAALQSQSISLLGKATNGANTMVQFNNTLLYYDDANTGWFYTPVQYWIPQSLYTFGAFSPYATSDAGSKLTNGNISYTEPDGEPTLTITDYNTGKVSGSFDARSEDILYTSYTRDNTTQNDYSAVPLEMGHLLAAITFKIRNASNEDIVEISDISLEGVEYKCTLIITTDFASISNNPLVVGGVNSSEYFRSDDRTTPNPFLPKGMSESEFTPVFDCSHLTVLPQSLYGKEITLNFKAHFYGSAESSSYTINLGNIDSITSWEAGKKYTYNLTITSEDILFQVTEVPWIEHDVKL